jgi:4-hydroxybenzoate polyprenyltransferase
VKTIRHLLELIRFSHTLFALPFAMLAAVMAWRLGGFKWFDLIGILLCMVTARSFAMSFNRLADRKLDASNPRTAGRHLPAGLLSVSQVAFFTVVCAASFIASTLFFLPNQLPLMLSIPVLIFLAGYSFTKRFTPLAHFWLGASLAFSPIAAWIAIRGETVLAHPTDLLPAIVLGGAVLSWVAGFDIIYACQDYDVDVAGGHHSVPARFGIVRALRLAALCHLATIAFLASLPFVYPSFGWMFGLAVGAVGVLLIYEHLLVRPDDLSRVNAAFFNVNAIISIGLFLVGSLDLLLHRVGY